jgi:hypothetical protein
MENVASCPVPRAHTTRRSNQQMAAAVSLGAFQVDLTWLAWPASSAKSPARTLVGIAVGLDILRSALLHLSARPPARVHASCRGRIGREHQKQSHYYGGGALKEQLSRLHHFLPTWCQIRAQQRRATARTLATLKARSVSCFADSIWNSTRKSIQHICGFGLLIGSRLVCETLFKRV